MFVSSVAPVADNAHSESDLDIRRSSSPHDDVVERDCKFKSSGIYKVIRYPVLLMNFCGIYVPSCCVCQVNRKLSQSGGVLYDTECPDLNARTLIYVKSVDGHPEQAKIVRGQCRNADGPRWSIIKKLTFTAMFLVHSVNTIRYIFILRFTSHNGSAFMFSLISYFILTFYFYLLTACSHANYAHFSAFIAALFSYDRKYALKCDFLRHTRLQVWVLGIGLSFQFAQSVLLIYGLVHLFDGFPVQLWPFSSVSGDWRVAIGLLCGVAVFFASCNVYGTHLFRAAVISILRHEFASLGKDLEDIMSRHSDRCDEAFDQLLKKVQAACRLRDRSYHVIKHTVASTYLFSVPMACFVVHGLDSGALQLDQMLLLAVNVSMALVILIHTTWSLASLNSEAASVSQAIYQGELEKFSKKFFQKAVLLTNMLTTQTNGMTVYGLFVVDWSTFLTVFGIVLTYSVFVVQFQSGAADCHCHVNATS